MKPARTVQCPICKQVTFYDRTNPFRPFCSERCKLIDLGGWASDNYRLPDNQPIPPDDAEI